MSSDLCKICTSCNELKPLTEYNKKGNKLQYHCRICTKAEAKAHYESNKKYYLDKAKKYSKDLREQINTYKAERGCERCDENDPCCLDFHHPDDNKEASVSKLITSGALKRTFKEIDKCIILCSNCHRKTHKVGN